MNDTLWSLEWQTLQNQFDSYEKYSLLIKLCSLLMATFGLLFQRESASLIAFVLIAWLMDAIWKTFQGRFEDRLLFIEAQLENQRTGVFGCQFNRSFQQRRPGLTQLLKDYCRHALRPTVAVIHGAIVMVVSRALIFN